MYKSRLQELCQKNQWALPDYATTRSGPDHSPCFHSTVSVGGLSFDGPSDCRSAKDAQSEAARLALDHLTGSLQEPPPLAVSGLPAAGSYQPNNLLPKGDESLERSQKNADTSTVQTARQSDLLGMDLSMYKSSLQQLCQKKQWSLPKYDIFKGGPDHIPNFQATVFVGGLSFDGPPCCRSAKEAQSKAARIAFDHFSIAVKSLPVVGSGSPQADAGNLVNDGMPKGDEALKISLDNAKDFIGQSAKQGDILEDEIPCKNQLQNYAQRRNLNLPSYDHVREGSIHTFRYKAKVMVGNHTFESQQFFSSLKEAENAAAKAALISLFAEGNQEDDPVFYKNLLLELIQKEGISTPVYMTICEGPSHMPMFASTVEVEGEKYKGITTRTKRQAEQNAAKVAWTALKERIESRQGRGLSSNFEVHKDVVISYPNASSAAVDLHKSQAFSIKHDKGDDHGCSYANEPTDVDTRAVVQPSTSQTPSQVAISPRHLNVGKSIASSSASSEMELKLTCASDGKKESAAPVSQHLKSAGWASSTPLVSQFSGKTAADAGVESLLQRDNSSPSCNRIQIYPRRPNLKLPEGVTVLPMSDDKWVAVKIESTSM